MPIQGGGKGNPAVAAAVALASGPGGEAAALGGRESVPVGARGPGHGGGASTAVPPPHIHPRTHLHWWTEGLRPLPSWGEVGQEGKEPWGATVGTSPEGREAEGRGELWREDGVVRRGTRRERPKYGCGVGARRSTDGTELGDSPPPPARPGQGQELNRVLEGEGRGAEGHLQLGGWGRRGGGWAAGGGPCSAGSGGGGDCEGSEARRTSMRQVGQVCCRWNQERRQLEARARRRKSESPRRPSKLAPHQRSAPQPTWYERCGCRAASWPPSPFPPDR